MGVRESNAGHDFHVLWVARRIISMLNPRSTLKRVLVEGISPVDLNGTTSLEFLAADVTEYYGGESFAVCEKIIIAQLKYSTKTPEKKWTAARLCACTNKEGKDNSVIGRLAQSYQELLKLPGIKVSDVAIKTELQLITNRPINPKFFEILKRAQNLIAKNILDYKDLISYLTQKEKEELDRLFRASSLSDIEFPTFLSLLRFNQNGSEARQWQKLVLLKELGAVVDNRRSSDIFNSICQVIREEALPEKEQSLGFDLPRVLLHLGVADFEDLYPSPNKINYPKSLIQTHEAKELTQAIITASERKVLAHGEAGVGKTTTAIQVADYLPNGSEVVVYDCYGGGSYFDTNSRRHTVKSIIQQLSNEISVLYGVPYMVQASNDIFDVLREFERRLEKVSQLIPEGGILTLVLDAADNAIAKAEFEKEDNPILRFWGIKLPDNCRLLVTARSSRVPSLLIPKGYKGFKLNGFDSQGSLQHLQIRFPAVSERLAHYFHDKTKGNPRLQDYVVNTALRNPSTFGQLRDLVRYAPKTPKEIFEDLIEDAFHLIGREEDAEKNLSVLVCLERPIPLHILAGACGISLTQAEELTKSLSPGVVLESNQVTLRDEDFETYLRERIPVEAISKAYLVIAEYLHAQAEADPYASSTVADYMNSSGQLEKLIDLALDETSLNGIKDDLRRIRVQQRRLKLAIAAAGALSNDKEALILLIKAVELKGNNSAVNALIQKNPELALQFGEGHSVMKVLWEDFEDSDYQQSLLGQLHFRFAAISAKAGDGDRAGRHLKVAVQWVRDKNRLERKSGYQWHLEAGDVAYGAEAIYRTHGLKDLIAWLKGWRPLDFVLQIVELLVRRHGNQLATDELQLLLESPEVGIRAKGVIASSLWAVGVDLPNANVKSLFKKLLKASQAGKLKEQLSEWASYSRTIGSDWPLGFAQLLIKKQEPAEEILVLLEKLLPAFPKHIPHPNLEFREFIAPLKNEALKLILSGRIENDAYFLLPEKYREVTDESGKKYTKKNDDFDETIGFVWPVFLLWAKVISKEIDDEQVPKFLLKELDRLKHSKYSYYSKRLGRQQIWFQVGVEALLALESSNKTTIESIIELAPQYLGDLGARNFWLFLAGKLTRTTKYTEFVIPTIEKVAHSLDKEPIGISERWETLLSCSETLSSYDPDLSRHYYELAFHAASKGVGNEILDLIKLGSTLLINISDGGQADKRATIKRFADLSEGFKPFITGDDEIPFGKVLKGSIKSDLVAGLALMCRWEQKGYLEYDDSIVFALEEEIEFLPPEECISLSFMAYPGALSRLWITHMDRLIKLGPPKRLDLLRFLDYLCNWSIKHLKGESQVVAVEKLVSWAKKHKLEHRPSIKQLEEILHFYSSLELNYDEGRSSSKSLAKEYKADLPTFRALKESQPYFSDDGAIEYLIQVGLALNRQERTPFLDEVIQLNVFADKEDPIIETLRTLLDKWKYDPKVENWASQNLTQFAINRLLRLCGYHGGKSHLASFCALPFAQTSRAAMLMPAVSDKLESLPIFYLERIAGCIAEELSSDDSDAVMQWLLTNLEKRLTDLSPIPGESFNASSFPESIPVSQALAHFYWFFFAHPDRKVRWKALHSAKDMIVLSGNEAFQSEMLLSILQISNNQNGGYFSSAENFFWISARANVLILLEHLSQSFTQLLAPVHLQLVKHALDENFPHAQIRELAKRILLNIQILVPGTMSPELEAQIRSVNIYKKKPLDVSQLSRKLDSFHFDDLDTLPYWFEPLARVFDIKVSQVEQLGLEWVANRWGGNDVECRKGLDEKSERYNHDIWNRHGSLPRAEVLRLYYSYHALLCAAGQLVESFKEIDPTDGFQGWLKEYLPALPSKWLSELLDPIPLRAELWGKINDDQWITKTDQDYLSAFLLTEPDKEDWIVIEADYYYGLGDKDGNSTITSALVPVSTAPALMRALQTADHYHYSLSSLFHADEEEVIDVESEFVVNSLLTEANWSGSEIEKHDGQASGVKHWYHIPKDSLITEHNLKEKIQFKEWIDKDGNSKIQLEIWSNTPQKDYDSNSYFNRKAFSEGNRLLFQKELLKDHLSMHNKCLLVEVVLRRHNQDRYSKKSSYDRGSHRIFLLHGDGRTETMAGACKAWS